MRERWLRFRAAAGARGDPEAAWLDLAARYGEPHRAYHTLRHVGHCLDELEGARDLAGDPVAVEMAIWYHDAVYDPRAKDSEERSAALAVEAGRAAGLPEPRLLQVADLIRVTAHTEPPRDPDARLLVDIDLAILGQPEGVFLEYEQRVRAEYAHLPDEKFRKGRTGFVTAFLARPFLYATPRFRDRYEAPARRNLLGSLVRWT